MKDNPQITELVTQIDVLKAQLAALRRQQPREIVRDYELLGPGSTSVLVSQLFGDHTDLLVIHNMGRSCPYCTLWADGLNGYLNHIISRTALVLVSPDTPEDQARFAADRGWRFKMASAAQSSFTKDLGFDGPDGLWPGVSGLHLEDDGSIVRVAKAVFGPGDDFCPPWPLFDLLADGINGWEPKYRYS